MKPLIIALAFFSALTNALPLPGILGAIGTEFFIEKK